MTNWPWMSLLPSSGRLTFTIDCYVVASRSGQTRGGPLSPQFANCGKLPRPAAGVFLISMLLLGELRQRGNEALRRRVVAGGAFLALDNGQQAGRQFLAGVDAP